MAADPEIVTAFNKLAWTIVRYLVPLLIALGLLGVGVELLKKKIRNKGKSNKDTLAEKCPFDGGTLIKRNGKFGPFIGCSNFPKCNYTRTIQ
jgi:hypothetical protein